MVISWRGVLHPMISRPMVFMAHVQPDTETSQISHPEPPRLSANLRSRVTWVERSGLKRDPVLSWGSSGWPVEVAGKATADPPLDLLRDPFSAACRNRLKTDEPLTVGDSRESSDAEAP